MMKHNQNTLNHTLNKLCKYNTESEDTSNYGKNGLGHNLCIIMLSQEVVETESVQIGIQNFNGIVLVCITMTTGDV